MCVCSEGKVNLGASKLFVVLVVQSALLLFLGYRILILETRPAELVNSNSTPVTLQPHTTDTAFSNSPTRAETRQIIREEMDALEGRLLDAIDEAGLAREVKPNQQTRRIGKNEVAQMNTAVENQINSFMSQGSASQAEMAKLEQMIARLPPGERIKAMGALNKAVNSGRLDVKF